MISHNFASAAFIYWLLKFPFRFFSPQIHFLLSENVHTCLLWLHWLVVNKIGWHCWWWLWCIFHIWNLYTKIYKIPGDANVCQCIRLKWKTKSNKEIILYDLCSNNRNDSRNINFQPGICWPSVYFCSLQLQRNVELHLRKPFCTK